MEVRPRFRMIVAMAELIARIDEGSELLFGESPASARLLSQVERVAGTPRTTVLLRGVRGRELELVARAIHARSGPLLDGLDTGAFDANGPFYGVHCAALSARTGAFESDDRVFGGDDGLFERASNGTLFLDEVADLSTALQAHLLELLERRAAEKPPLRIVASTAADLEAAVDDDRFRADLFYRLNVLTIRVPRLHERAADIPAVVDAVLTRMRRMLGVRTVVSDAALEALAAHAWPGNLFELEATLGKAVVAAGGGDGTIEPEHLDFASASRPHGELVPAVSAKRSLRDVEEETIRRILVEEGGNRSRAARTLGINRTTLYNKLRQYGIS